MQMIPLPARAKIGKFTAFHPMMLLDFINLLKSSLSKFRIKNVISPE